MLLFTVITSQTVYYRSFLAHNRRSKATAIHPAPGPCVHCADSSTRNPDQSIRRRGMLLGSNKNMALLPPYFCSVIQFWTLKLEVK
jgi:hypothetical protein